MDVLNNYFSTESISHYLLLKKTLAVNEEATVTPESFSDAWEQATCNFEQTVTTQMILIVCWDTKLQTSCKRHRQSLGIPIISGICGTHATNTEFTYPLQAVNLMKVIKELRDS